MRVNPINRLEILRKTKIGQFSFEYEAFPGRFEEEIRFNVYLVDEFGNRSNLPLFSGYFFGGRDYYSPWIDTQYNDKLKVGNKDLDLMDTELERALFVEFGSLLPKGGTLYVVYTNLRDVMFELSKGVPPVVTRIGYAMLQAGFTSFKDLYYLDGEFEGGPKLQGVKPSTVEEELKQLRDLLNEVRDFLRVTFPWPRTKERAEEVEYYLIRRIGSIIRTSGLLKK